MGEGGGQWILFFKEKYSLFQAYSNFQSTTMVRPFVQSPRLLREWEGAETTFLPNFEAKLSERADSKVKSWIKQESVMLLRS